jgi:hypothetical protein
LLPVGCGAGGGAPWQLPHIDWVPSTCVQTGLGLLPPNAALPWQLVVQLVPFHIEPIATEEPNEIGRAHV